MFDAEASSQRLCAADYSAYTAHQHKNADPQQDKRHCKRYQHSTCTQHYIRKYHKLCKCKAYSLNADRNERYAKSDQYDRHRKCEHDQNGADGDRKDKVQYQQRNICFIPRRFLRDLDTLKLFKHELGCVAVLGRLGLGLPSLCRFFLGFCFFLGMIGFALKLPSGISNV